MPADRDVPDARRSVVPEAAGRSLWLASIWTGVGAALVGMMVSIVAVAVLWLPTAGASGSAGSAVRAGVLTYLASLHAGITIDGVPTALIPLGLTVLVGLVGWRAGGGLADAALDLDEDDPARLLQAGGLQVLSFASVCTIAAAASRLGTSSVSPAAVAFAAAVLFAVTGGVAFVRATPLRELVRERVPTWLGPALRAGAVAAAVYVAAGAVLVLGSVLAHHAQVEALSAEVGGGWAGLPVLLLGILAAPNAAVAGASYLAGPGFAVGNDSLVALSSSPHGTLPAFPVLGAVPTSSAPVIVWVLAVLTPLAAGAYVAALAYRAEGWRERWISAGRGAGAAAVIGLVLAWQAGGGIGSDRLAAVGASPWQFGSAVLGGVAFAAAAVLGSVQAVAQLRVRQAADTGPAMSMRSVLTTIKDTGKPDDETDVHGDTEGPAEASEASSGGGKLAG